MSSCGHSTGVGMQVDVWMCGDNSHLKGGRKGKREASVAYSGELDAAANAACAGTDALAAAEKLAAAVKEARVGTQMQMFRDDDSALHPSASAEFMEYVDGIFAKVHVRLPPLVVSAVAADSTCGGICMGACMPDASHLACTICTTCLALAALGQHRMHALLVVCRACTLSWDIVDQREAGVSIIKINKIT